MGKGSPSKISILQLLSRFLLILLTLFNIQQSFDRVQNSLLFHNSNRLFKILVKSTLIVAVKL